MLEDLASHCLSLRQVWFQTMREPCSGFLDASLLAGSVVDLLVDRDASMAEVNHDHCGWNMLEPIISDSSIC
jgi:hypothetical protein